MKHVLKALGCLCIILFISSTSFAKGWRGITPFRSTRADVEKLLGEPPPPPKNGKVFYTPNKGRSIYFTDEGQILIVYANDAVPAAVDCLGKIPVDTVLLIEVMPEKDMKLSDLGIDEKRFKKFDPSQPPGIGFAGYIDEEEGLAIRTREGKVDQINYVGAKKDRHLCPTYYPNPEDSIRILVDFFDHPPPCPNIIVTASDEMAEAGAILTFSVSVSGGDPGVTPTYRWSVSAGRVVSGQGMTSISVDTSGAAGKAIKATVEVGGYDRSCMTEASGVIRIKSPAGVRQPATSGPQNQ